MFDWVRLRPRAGWRFRPPGIGEKETRRQTAVPGSEAVTRRNVPMKWTQLATGLVVALSTAACLAETPEISGDRSTALSLIQQGRMYGSHAGQSWWSRYGEPVNATALSQTDASPSDKGGYVPPAPLYGDGYVFGPGSCDCPPPCIWQLWAGYYQNPLRCYGDGHLLNHRCRHCGAYGGGGCGCGCGKGCGCTTKADCGCTTPVTCTSTASCGCKP